MTSTVKRLDDRLNTFSTAIAQIPALAERVGELKNWRQIALIILTGFGGAFFGWILKSGKLQGFSPVLPSLSFLSPHHRISANYPV